MCQVCYACESKFYQNFKQKTDENAFLTECDSVREPLCDYILGSLKYRQPPHLLDLKPALERPSLPKESLSPSSEDLFSLEDMLEHSAMFEFYWHFFQIVATANWKGLDDDFIQYLTS